MEHSFDWIRGAVFPYINFIIFLTVAIVFFRKPLQSMAAQRRAELDALVAAAKKAKDEAERQHAELQNRMRGLDAELTQLREAVKAEAEREAKQIVVQAQSIAQHVKEEAKRVAETEVESAKRALREEIIAQVHKQVESRITTELKGDGHKQVIAKQIETIKNIRAEG